MKESEMMKSDDSAPVLLYDGVCGFCNQTVQTIIARDRRGTLRFAALQSDFGQSVVARHASLRGVDSVVFVEGANTSDERVRVRSDAALCVAAYLGGWWKLLLVARIIPAPARDYGYDLFARHRYRWFGKYDSCLLPPPEVRARFLDV